MDLSKAKDASLIAKWTGFFVLLVASVLKWVGVFANCEISEICTVALTIEAVFCTVDINILADKFTKKRESNG